MRKLVLVLIGIYQKTFSLMIGPRCRFYPSCSEYAKIAFMTHAFPYAIWLSVKRLLKCHPWHEGGLDLPPPHPVLRTTFSRVGEKEKILKDQA